VVDIVETHGELQQLEKKYGTPFYLFNKEKLLKNYDEIETAFAKRYSKFIIGYSYKTNYLPYLCNLVKNKGAYAEVVSRIEYELALKIGQNPSQIIFNGPVKQYEDIETALDNNSIVNLDSWYEVEYVLNYAKKHPGRLVKVGLRININLIDKKGFSHIQDGLSTGRFGFSVDEQGLLRAIDLLKKLDDIKINCLHGHTSTSSRSTWVFETITRTLCDIAVEHLGESIEYIDVGGGIYGKLPKVMGGEGLPSFDDYAETICGVMNEYRWPQNKQPCLILEPGVSMVASILDFVVKVIDVKIINDRQFALVDGSAYNIKPSLHKMNLPHAIIKSNRTEKKGIYSVVGNTCMEKDILLENVETSVIEKGDFIRIENAGAYTIVLSPPFINVAPPILTKENGNYNIIRNKQNFDDMFGNYLFN